MGFYLRKSLKLGPIRLNLSKSGLGISGGVTGARIGINSRGQAYTHAGRFGIYHRQSLGGVRRRAGPVYRGGDRVEVREDTDATYAAIVISTERPSLRDRFMPKPSSKPFLLGCVADCAVIVILALTSVGTSFGTGRIAIVGLATIAGIGFLYLARIGERTDRAARKINEALAKIIAEPESTAGATQKVIESLFADAFISPDQQTRICATTYIAVLAAIVEDGRVSDEELGKLAVFESAIGLSSDFVLEARTSAFHEAYLEAVSDHVLLDIEEASLVEIRTRLGVSEMEIEAELDIIRQLSDMRMIRETETMREIEAGIKLQQGEICYFKGAGRMLKDKILKRFQEDGQKYVVRGLVIHKEGQLFITNKRLLLVHAGTSSIRHEKIIDLELDYDQSLLTITKDGVQKPIYITTPDPIRAGAILAKAAGL